MIEVVVRLHSFTVVQVGTFSSHSPVFLYVYLYCQPVWDIHQHRQREDGDNCYSHSKDSTPGKVIHLINLLEIKRYNINIKQICNATSKVIQFKPFNVILYIT